jgi:hypothetical protein
MCVEMGYCKRSYCRTLRGRLLILSAKLQVTFYLKLIITNGDSIAALS